MTTSKRSSCPFVPVPQKVSVAAIASISSKVLRGLLHREKRKGQNSSEKMFFALSEKVLPTGSSGGGAIPMSKLGCG